MTHSEATDFARKCKGCYPKMTDQHIAVLLAKIQPFDRTLAAKALSEYVDRVAEWNHAQFMAVLGRVTFEATQGPLITPAERTRLERDAEKGVRARVMLERERHIRIIEAMPAEDLERRRLAALAVMPSSFATRYADKDPRDSLYLIALIVEQVDIEAGEVLPPEPDQKTLSTGRAS